MMILAAGLMWVGCANSGQSDDSEASADSAKVADLSLPLPQVPDSLRTPQERAAYAAMHFWDAFDFANDRRVADTAFVEQNFANYIVLLNAAAPEQAQEAVAHLLKQAGRSPAGHSFILATAEKYLYHPNSPMRNEVLYLMFLDAIADDESYDYQYRCLIAERRFPVSLNQPGSMTDDFRMVTREGKATTLHRAIKADTTLVMFYDSDCENCKALVAHLTQPGAHMAYPVLAIDVTQSRKEWDEQKGTMPADWQVAFATEDVDDGLRYHFPALPALYLLAPDGTVILKDFSVQ